MKNFLVFAYCTQDGPVAIRDALQASFDSHDEALVFMNRNDQINHRDFDRVEILDVTEGKCYKYLSTVKAQKWSWKLQDMLTVDDDGNFVFTP